MDFQFHGNNKKGGDLRVAPIFLNRFEISDFIKGSHRGLPLQNDTRAT